MIAPTSFEDDPLQRGAFAERLERFIKVEQHFVEGSLVVALSAKFGSGKSTFLNLWVHALSKKNPETERPIVVSLNAWESDYIGDPLFAIVSGLAASLLAEKKSAKRLLDAAKDLGWVAVSIGAKVTERATGFNPTDLAALPEKKAREREGRLKIPTDAFTAFENRKTAMRFMKDEIAKIVENSKQRIFFLVDELDRCRPDYAIAFLETIKHIFDTPGAVFVLAADRRHLENSARTAFGDDLDFEEYYRRFVHREISLPPITKKGYSRLTGLYIDEYLRKEPFRVCSMILGQQQVGYIISMLTGLGLVPRQVQAVFRILGHVLETQPQYKASLSFTWAACSVLMVALRVGDRKTYESLSTQSMDPRDAYDYLFRVVGESNVMWWWRIILSGGGLRIRPGATIEEVVQSSGVPLGEPIGIWVKSLGRFFDEWRVAEMTGLVRIGEMIEQIGGVDGLLEGNEVY